jgi:hypothetical protein
VTEKFFKSFTAAEDTTPIDCTVCGLSAERLVSAPLPAHLYGDPSGYHKPSALKRHSTKTIHEKNGNR